MADVLYDILRNKFAAMDERCLLAKRGPASDVVTEEFRETLNVACSGKKFNKTREKFGWAHKTIPLFLGWVHIIKCVEHAHVNKRNRSKMYKYRKSVTLCECCGIVPPVHTHHIISVKDGGKEENSNYQALCLDCHRSKHPEISPRFIKLNTFNILK